MSTFNRRDFMKLAAACGALGLAGTSNLMAQEKLLKVIAWGGSYGEVMRANWMEPFASQSGITSEIQLQSSSMETLAALRANKGRMDDDLWLSAISPATLAMRDGLLEPIPVDRLANAAQLPENMANENFVGVWNLPYGIIYNSETTPFEIKEWTDLKDERLKGKIGAPYGANYNGLFIALLAALAGGDEKNVDPGFELAKAMKPNFSIFTTSDAEQVRLMSSGEIDVIAFAPVANYFSLRKAGPQFRFVSPKPFIPVSINNIVMLKGADVEAATRFIDFAISKDAQEGIAKQLGCLPINTQAAVSPELREAVPADTQFRYMDEPTISTQLSAWNDRWQQEIQ